MELNTLIQDVKRIREALVIRGFSVRVLHNRLIPESGAAWEEWYDVQSVLDWAGVEYRAAGNSLVILKVSNAEDAARAIQTIKATGNVREPQWYDSNWKSFTRRKFGRKVSAMDLSPGIAYLVKKMGKAGILTGFCTDGQGRRRPYIEFAGPWNAIWFDYLFTYHMSLELDELHYPWLVNLSKHGRVRLAPGLASRQKRWELDKLQEDTVQMGRWLDRHAADIRELKRTCFKYRSMKREAEALAEDYEGLKRWMLGKIRERRNLVTFNKQKRLTYCCMNGKFGTLIKGR